MPENFYLLDGKSPWGFVYLFIPAPGNGWDDVIGRWAAAILTLAIFSFLFKDNPLFKLAEHIFIGVGTGYQLARVFNDAIYDKAWRPMMVPSAGSTPDWTLIIPIVLGLMTIL